MIVLALVVGLLCIILPSAAGAPQESSWLQLAADDRAAITRCAEGRVAELIAAYALYDAGHKGGLGNSEATTSGALGWGESGFLHNYMLCFQVTRDTYWLDKIIDHFDRIVQAMSDPEGDGFLSWYATRYSVGVVEVKPAGDVGELKLTPPSQRIWATRGGDRVTGHDYTLEFIGPARYRLRDETEGQILVERDYEAKQTIEEIPGAKLVLDGPARTGAKFRIATLAPESIPYIVHDGMVAYPIALFIEAALGDPALQGKYGAKAQEYAELLERHFLRKWEQYWVELPDGAGAYTFTANPTERFPRGLLPHNQYLALARAWLVMADIPGLPASAAYREKASKMATYFRRHLRDNEGAYVWNYWDPRPDEGIKTSGPEDCSHATIDIGFAVQAARRGVVFGPEDLRRLAKTYLDVMWNGSMDDPRFGSRVDRKEGDKRAWWEWVGLARADRRVWDVAWAMFQADNEPATMCPMLLDLYSDLVGIDAGERARAAAVREEVLKAFEEAVVFNGDFELPGPGGAVGWTLSTWTPDEGGRAEVIAEGRGGGSCVALTGGAEGEVNVIAQPSRQFEVTAGAKIVIKAYYRGDKTAKPRLSLLGCDAGGERLQYDNSPTFEPTEDWTATEWEIEAAEGVVRAQLVLRNGGPGTAWFDDVEVEIVP